MGSPRTILLIAFAALLLGTVLLLASRTGPARPPTSTPTPAPSPQPPSTSPRPTTTTPTSVPDPSSLLSGLSATLRRLSPPSPNSPQNTADADYDVLRGTPGFWRLARTEGGVWWFLSPDNKREFLNTVTTVQPFQLARDPAGPHYISRDYDGGITENGNIPRWATLTLARVRDAGFKGLGGWSNPAFHDLDTPAFPGGVPITRDLNLWKWVNGDKNTVLLYDPEFARLLEVAVREQVTKLRDSRNLVGYYTDNELDWGDGFMGPRIYFDHRPPTDPSRQEVIKVVRQLWPTPADFNRDWGTTLTSWEEFEKLESLPLSFDDPAGSRSGRKGNYPAYIRLLETWLEHLAQDYFRLTTTLVRKYDPNHLVLGVRFKAWAPPEVVRASRGWTDAQSLNSYVGDARLDRDMFTMIHRDSGGQPLIITEYSFHALDGRSGNRNTVGFAAQVLDQRARAEGYRLMTTRFARVPWIVGADWFQWADEPPSGRHFDGEDVNFGIVDIDDKPYDHMLAAVRRTTPLLNTLHAQSTENAYPADASELPTLQSQGTAPGQSSNPKSHNPAASGGNSVPNPKSSPPYPPSNTYLSPIPVDASDIWRDSYAIKPVQRIPYLDRPPTLNGELSDWPDATRISGVRHSKTLGLERSRVPLPNVHAGWREEGLYLAFEVFDDDIQGADPKGWWWTRDCLEWWIATRPIPEGQNYYDGYCHQFFFVPHEFPQAGQSGTVGRWHRPGDALTDNLIPEPHIKQSARIFPGRYVVEMLIPPASLTGWDPEREPRLAFNLHARNWQHAIDHFWSAPKDLQTQLRPNTWGTWYLSPKR